MERGARAARVGAWMAAGLLAAVAAGAGCADEGWAGRRPDPRGAEPDAPGGEGTVPVADVVFDPGSKDGGAADAGHEAPADPGAQDGGAGTDGGHDAGGPGRLDGWNRGDGGTAAHDAGRDGPDDPPDPAADGDDGAGTDAGPAPDPFEALCRPCLDDGDCVPSGGVDEQRRACMDLGPEGRYCGTPCARDGDCPADYRCLAAPGVLPAARQCVPRSLRCPCTERFVLGAFRTRCEVSSAFGTCTALRTCDQACPAPTPAPESCNGIDDDCDGRTDEGTAEQCFPGACDPARGACTASCSDGGDCASGACCSGTCRDLRNDRGHCGTCTTACRNDHGTTACRNGTCRPDCGGGWDDCDGHPANGCETSLATLDDCGACGAACARTGGTASCVAGTCVLTGCDAGHASCDGSDANGCEADLAAASNTCDTADWLGAACADRACGAFCGAAGWRSLALRSGRGGRWFRASLDECSGCCADLSARIVLEGPAGVDYDLFVYGACGVLLGSSTRGPGLPDQVVLQRADGCTGGDSGFEVRIEVRLHSGSTCGPWTLSVDGTACD